MAPRTLFDKIWDSHVVERLPDGTCILYIDRHLLHEVTSPQAFEGLRLAGRKLRRPDLTIAVADHNIPTVGPRTPPEIKEEDSRIQVQTLESNVKEFGVPYIPILDVRQGIVHIIGPEMGLSLPGTTIVCGDSHTSTHGAMGALAFGIGTSEVEHVMATQTLLQAPQKNMRIDVSGTLGLGCTAKDIVLAIIGKITTAGGTGHVIEYTGDTIRALDMAGRMTVSNMTIEGGARAGLIAPDQTTFDYVKGREYAPKGEAYDQAVAYWKTLPTDPSNPPTPPSGLSLGFRGRHAVVGLLLSGAEHALGLLVCFSAAAVGVRLGVGTQFGGLRLRIGAKLGDLFLGLGPL